LTINYLKPFEPGDPIDINVLNKLIQNVNYLSSQIAQIYKLPAVEAPVLVSGPVGVTGGSTSSGTSTSTTNNPGTSYVDYSLKWIDNIINFSSVNNRVVRSVTSTVLSTYLPGIKYNSFEVLSASTSSLFFHPGGNKNSRSQASGVRLDYYRIGEDKQSFSFMPKKNGVDGTVYRAGINGPQTNGGSIANRLLSTFDVTVRLYK
jgi:hypothetical protein